jgi:serine/threonine protein kinase
LLLKALQHPNVVSYLQTDIAADRNGVEIVLEYMPGGSLRSLLDKYGKFDENLIKVYLR